MTADRGEFVSTTGTKHRLAQLARLALENTLQAKRDAASPVPADQPEPKPCNCADFPGLAGEHSPWCGNTAGPRFSITGALPPVEQPEER